MTHGRNTHKDFAAIKRSLLQKAEALGIDGIAITGVEPGRHEAALERWLAAGYHADMAYMERHGRKRSRPDELVPGTLRVISVRLNYLHSQTRPAPDPVSHGDQAFISRYALGRDYHKVLRKKLQQLCTWLTTRLSETRYRVFVDSGPVLERGFAQLAGLGWIGKNTMLIHPRRGSYFFLGEILCDIPLPVDPPFESEHCGRCRACLDVCPTRAFPAPYILDAGRCISYLTIENRGTIPIELRTLIGNRVFGCDDCQEVCPWNRFARFSDESDFKPRHHLDHSSLLSLFLWTESEFEERTAGSPIRRTGYIGWLRNLAVALGNAPFSEAIIAALEAKLEHPSELLREHVIWALNQQRSRRSG